MARIGAWLAVLLCLIAASRVVADNSTPLARGRADAALKAVHEAELAYKTGRADAERVYLWSVRWCETQRDSKGNLPQAAAQEHLKRMQELEAHVKARVASGSASSGDLSPAEYYRIEAELWAQTAK